jgi:hypothetical protein
MRNAILLSVALATAFVAAHPTAATGEEVVVKLDTTQVPELADWGEEARDLMVKWHPRFANLLASKGFTPPNRMEFILQKSDKGIGGTSGNRIVVSSHWIEKHAEDIGLVAHELVHIIQRYPSPQPGWVTEGIADYMRWAIFEGKPLDFFPVSLKEQGYRDSYRVTAGFLLWLESDQAPGIVRRLNAAMRNRAYDDAVFEKAAGKPLDELWKEYQAARK